MKVVSGLHIVNVVVMILEPIIRWIGEILNMNTKYTNNQNNIVIIWS